jgi:deazaflavin-dependent oxidoreductase (nitroreductase family)
MPLPRWVARFNKRITNRFVEPVIRRFRRYAVIHHSGRSTGLPYRTPVYVFANGRDFFVALTYGPGADWVRNVSAGGGSCETGGSTRTMSGVTVVERPEVWPHLPWLVRVLLRMLRVSVFLKFRLDEQ